MKSLTSAGTINKIAIGFLLTASLCYHVREAFKAKNTNAVPFESRVKVQTQPLQLICFPDRVYLIP